MSVVETALTDREAQTPSSDDVYDDGYLRVEHRNYYMACAGQSIFLPRTEFLLISRLVRSIERVVSAEECWLSAVTAARRGGSSRGLSRKTFLSSAVAASS